MSQTQTTNEGAKAMTNARQEMENFIASQTDDMLLAAITQIATKSEDAVSIDERVARAALLNEYEKRNGGEAVDALMDVLGL